MTNSYTEEVSRRAQAHGIQVEATVPELRLKLDGVESFHITEADDILYRTAVNITVAQDRKLRELIQQARVIGNYMEAMEQAPFLNVSGAAGEYKLLSDHNHYQDL